MTNFQSLLKRLADAGVEFIVVGGVAASAHGSARFTQDLDIVYRRTRENIQRLTSCVAAFQPYLRGAPPGLPFRFDLPTIESGLNFTLDTELGPFDALGEIAGGGRYEDLFPQSVTLEIFGVPCRCLNLDTLIHVKRAAGRPKDFEAIAELEVLREEKRKQNS